MSKQNSDAKAMPVAKKSEESFSWTTAFAAAAAVTQTWFKPANPDFVYLTTQMKAHWVDYDKIAPEIKTIFLTYDTNQKLQECEKYTQILLDAALILNSFSQLFINRQGKLNPNENKKIADEFLIKIADFNSILDQLTRTIYSLRNASRGALAPHTGPIYAQALLDKINKLEVIKNNKPKTIGVDATKKVDAKNADKEEEPATKSSIPSTGNSIN